MRKVGRLEVHSRQHVLAIDLYLMPSTILLSSTSIWNQLHHHFFYKHFIVQVMYKALEFKMHGAHSSLTIYDLDLKLYRIFYRK